MPEPQQLCRADVARAPGRFGGGKCGRPAVAVVEYGCLHEHLDAEPVCAWHRDLLLAGDTLCARCWAGPLVSGHESHPCRLLGRVASVLAAERGLEDGLE